MPDEANRKLNAALQLALKTWRESGDAIPDDGITVTLSYEGGLAAIEALGFETHTSGDGEAMGVVRFKDLPRLAAHPGVIWIKSGMQRRMHDTAVPEIKARAPDAGVLGTDGLWKAILATGALTQIGAGHATGKDVIVAVIDTGIDITHPMFLKALGPPKTTRIKRIWDQGLDPADISVCPDQALISPGGRYGVEYTDTDIETAINAGPMIDHKDCDGHGTHVAGIAAGGNIFPAGGDATFVGVAPEADIIAVKVLDVPDGIRFKLAAGTGALVDADRRFRDALLYCLRTARNLGKPVVINESFGNSFEAGDSLDSDARAIDTLMDPAQAAGADHFPSGAIVVRACGNDGDARRKLFVHLTMPAAGEVTIPWELKDNRAGHDTKFKQCANTLHKPAMFLVCWYKRDFDNVKFAVKLPHRNVFEGGGDMGVGGNFDDGYLVRPGPPQTLANVAIAANQFEVSAIHGTEAAVPHPAGGTVRRHSFTLAVIPKVSGGVVSYLEGIYEVRVRAPAGTELFFAGDHDNWGGPGLSVFFRVAATMADGVTATDPAILAAVSSEFTAVDALGKNAVSVAAYNDLDDKIAPFSSRGPLRDFSDPAGSKPLVAFKPDVAAPGVDIKSAEGADTNAGPLAVRGPGWHSGIRFVELSGTSMAAPMITGVIALMLGKRGTLTTTEVQTILTAAARPGVDPPSPGAAHDRAYGKGMVDALASHTGT